MSRVWGRHPLIGVLLCALLASCSSIPTESESRDEFVAQQKSAAKELHRAGKLAQSRILWLTLLTLDDSSVEATAAVAELDEAVARKVDDAWGRGRRAYRSGNARQGDTWMLRILALQPGHSGALQYLRKSSSARSHLQQKAKSSEETTLKLARKRAAPGGVNEQVERLFSNGDYAQVLVVAGQVPGDLNPEIAGAMRKSHIALADAAGEKGNMELALNHVQGAITSFPMADDPLLARSAKLRAELSSTLYKQGLNLINTDLAGAVAALEKSVFYNPYNNAAKRKLLQVQTLQKNLMRIQRGG